MMAKLFNPYLLLIVLGLCCDYRTQGFVFPEETSSGVCKTFDGERGKCVPILECTTIKEYIDKLKNNKASIVEIKKKLDPYICNGGDTYPDLCCTSTSIPVDLTEDKLKLLPMNDCGTTPNINKILNGINASLYEFPWMAALMYESPNGPEFQCAGTLISKRYVLTVAHCLKKANKRYQRALVNVRLGEHNFDSDIDCEVSPYGKTCAPAPQNFDVSLEDAIVHPKFNPITLSNDIALIRLRRDADLTAVSVKPVCLPANKITRRSSFKTKLTASGWSKTKNGTYSPHLLKVTVSAVENDKCSTWYTGSVQISEQQLCAGGKNSESTCGSDSGGPLMQQVPVSGVLRTVQYGIISAGPASCEKIDIPVIYTRVTSYIDWILDNMKS